MLNKELLSEICCKCLLSIKALPFHTCSLSYTISYRETLQNSLNYEGSHIPQNIYW